MAGELQNPGERIAVGGVAAAGGRQRAGRVGADELDQDALGGLGRAGAEVVARAGMCGQRAAEPRSVRNRFRKPGPGDLDALERSAEPLAPAPPSRSATSRGGSPSAGASSIAALVE